MARQSANSLLNSLKGKIWLATSALAFFICTFGLISYLIASFLVTNVFFAVFTPFLLMGFVVTAFGWWLSNEVVSPIEKVSLLAKSLERGAVTSLPRTSGSTETDELLQTLHRTAQQTQNLVTLMEKVAGGNIDVALTPLQNSDRLSSAFQKLLAKVSESISAKQNLEKLEAAIEHINGEIAGIRTGNLQAELTNDFPQTAEISETVNYLVNNLNELVVQIKNETQTVRFATSESGKTLQTIIKSDEAKVQQLNRVKTAFEKIPNSVQKIAEELLGSAQTANQSMENARKGTKTAEENVNAVGSLRQQIQSAVKRTERLHEHSDEINQVVKTVEDLAHRANMIALNASLQAVESSDKGQAFSVLAEEVERLAVRAENTNQQISSLNQSISAEIGEVEHSLQTLIGEAAKLAGFALESGNSLNELERYVGQFLNLQKKLISYSLENSDETEKAFLEFVDSIDKTEKSVEHLKEAGKQIEEIVVSVENMQFSVADFKISKQPDAKEIPDVEEAGDLMHEKIPVQF